MKSLAEEKWTVAKQHYSATVRIYCAHIINGTCQRRDPRCLMRRLPRDITDHHVLPHAPPSIRLWLVEMSTLLTDRVRQPDELSRTRQFRGTTQLNAWTERRTQLENARTGQWKHFSHRTLCTIYYSNESNAAVNTATFSLTIDYCGGKLK